jgi:hypothetical protein
VAAWMAVGAALAAVYLAPALEHMRYFSLERLMHTGAYWSLNFPPVGPGLIERTGPWPSYVQFIGILVILSTVAVALLAAMTRGPTRAFWTAVAGVSLLLTLPVSAFVWRTVPGMAQVQFPWRFLAIVSLATAALTAAAWDSRPARAPAIGMVAMALLWSAFFARMFVQLHGQDHRMAWITPFTDDALVSAWVGTGAAEIPMEQVRVEGGGGSAVVERWAPRDIRLRLHCGRESPVTVHQFYYPGWKANTPGPVEPSETGQIRVTAPAGDYELRLWLDGGLMEQTGRWISAVAAVFLGGWCWSERRRSRAA